MDWGKCRNQTATHRDTGNFLREAFNAIRTSLSPSKEDIRVFIALIIERAMIVKGLYEVNGITEDPDDDMFIACAMEGNAHYIVSCDPHLRNLKHYRGIQIIDTASFIEKVNAHR